MSKTYLCDFAYETIKERIIRCQYAPNTYITEERLGEELNISRTYPCCFGRFIQRAHSKNHP